MAHARRAGERTKIVVLGGGFGGAYAAQRLCHKKRDDVDVLLIDRNNYILFYPLLVEAGVGLIEGRHVVVPIRQFMGHGEFLMAEVLGANLENQTVRYRVVGSEEINSVTYDHLVFALGAVTRLPPMPGLKEYGFQLKSLNDALQLRDRGIRLLELANTIDDQKRRQALLRFVVVGANYSGIEMAGEYEEFMHRAAKAYPNIDPQDVQIVLVEHGPRILPQTSARLAAYAHVAMTLRGITILTETSLSEVAQDHVLLSDGKRLDTHTVIWTAGIAPHPLIREMGLPETSKGWVDCQRDLRVKGYDNVWAIGDPATVLDEHGKPYAPTAQNASRQGPHVAKNILATLRDDPTAEYNYDPLGAFGAFGRRQAVASLWGLEFRGFIAWFIYRSAYLFKMPTLGRKVRLGADWFLDFLLPPAPVQLGIHRPGSPDIEERITLR